ncbi:PPA1309 family protein [Nocardioides bruguierae]|uniref:PPA1309 family protein n=1 Tax=Nocardioides bruguierae TaxID=2945102 RepID=UPI00201FF43F|nr:PPA1309 family protein [Nocardioides bruguierae]MCL8024897.1 PPA1309 family protein [Nocardioides bruguierae]
MPDENPTDPTGPTGLPEDPFPETVDAAKLDLDADPALATAVLEIEKHVAEAGWDQPARLFGLVDTAALVAQEPELAALMGLDQPSEDGSLTPVEQDSLNPNVPLEQVLPGISWPGSVAGCAAVVERIVLPPEVHEDIPEDDDEATEFAANHPLRQEMRLVAGTTRTGSTYCAMRFRSHDEESLVVGGTDLVPSLLELLSATLVED